jgi:glutathione-regulated potassium-efflux system ancillary protein KefC
MEHVPAWLLNALTFLTAAVVMVPLSKALGLGSIIGYLVAGIAIGPWGLGLIANVGDILHFAEFGVVLMLFLVGLELEPERLWRLRGPIFGQGAAQMLGCTAVLFGCGIAVGADWRLALVAALGLSLSSTAIALQVFGERNLMQAPGGQTGFAILLFQDLAAIPVLALLPLLGSGVDAGRDTGFTGAVLEALKAIAAVGGVVLGGRLLLRPLLRWIARSRTPEIFTATALLLVTGLAVAMQALGLSMALGAFLGGVLLADSEYRRELETDIEPFKGLLMGLFFIAVGMGVDVGGLLAQPVLLLGLVLGFMLLKAGVILLIVRRLGIDLSQQAAVTLLLAQGGEFAFVVFQAAGPDVLPRETASLLTGTVALSMLLSPLMLIALDRWMASSDKARRQREAAQPSFEPQQAKVIICGFGRYGQIVARMLGTQDVQTTVLDQDPDTIANAREFGARVFYGDATRLDLLRTAGAATATVLVVAVDDVKASLEIVDAAREHFPKLKIAARARNIGHFYQLLDRKVEMIERELFDSSLLTAQSVLQALGWDHAEAQEARSRFRAGNLRLSMEAYPHYKDRAKLIAVSKEGRQQFIEQMARERAEKARLAAGGAASPDNALGEPPLQGPT